MTALAMVGTYIFIAVPNVELGSAVFFITGLIFGLEIGLTSMLISSIIFSVINPWGAFIPLIWFSQAIAWTIVVMAGYLSSRIEITQENVTKFLGLMGFVVTLLFDLITDLGYSVSFSVPFLVAIVAGLPFHIIHIVSNVIIFSLGIPPIERIIRNSLSDMIWEKSIDTSLTVQEEYIETE
jgi:energy-coupling factor transport system substrate-specific component